MTYNQVHFYSPFHDAAYVRMSVFDHAGQEFWVEYPQTQAGKTRREAREAALDAIEAAMMVENAQPGPVTL